MRIAKLYMDPQDKTRFEIQGKSSVKYHLKANHVVEAKRWFWALNNAIQWTKDEAKEEQKRQQLKVNMLRQAKAGRPPSIGGARDIGLMDSTKPSGRTLAPDTAIGAPLTTHSSRVSFQNSALGPGSFIGDDEGSIYDSSNSNVFANDMPRTTAGTKTSTLAGDMDDEEEYGDDASSHEHEPTGKDAFNITAHSASLQLSLLAQVSEALQAESLRDPPVPISDPEVAQAIETYGSAVKSLQGLVGDLLKISRDRDAYWQYRLDREADVRRLWEDSMTRVAQEQEELEERIGESEDKRKRTKRALREALESTSGIQSLSQSRDVLQADTQVSGSLETSRPSLQGIVPSRQKSIGFGGMRRRRSTIANLTNLSDSDSDEDEEFFDAIDAGEVEVGAMPMSLSSAVSPSLDEKHQKFSDDIREVKRLQISPSFKGYEDPVRTRLKMDADDRPKISLWVGLLDLRCNGFMLTLLRVSSSL